MQITTQSGGPTRASEAAGVGPRPREKRPRPRPVNCDWGPSSRTGDTGSLEVRAVCRRAAGQLVRSTQGDVEHLPRGEVRGSRGGAAHSTPPRGKLGHAPQNGSASAQLGACVDGARARTSHSRSGSGVLEPRRGVGARGPATPQARNAGRPARVGTDAGGGASRRPAPSGPAPPDALINDSPAVEGAAAPGLRPRAGASGARGLCGPAVVSGHPAWPVQAPASGAPA